MSELIECQPPVSAIYAQPYTVFEIDTHPYRDRIWATILKMREPIQNALSEIDEHIDQAGRDGYDEGHYDATKGAELDILSIIASSQDNDAAISAIKEWVKK